MPSAAEPANPTNIRLLYIRRIFRAVCFITTSPCVIWPSPAIATTPSRFTAMIVVPCLSCIPWVHSRPACPPDGLDSTFHYRSYLRLADGIGDTRRASVDRPHAGSVASWQDCCGQAVAALCAGPLHH